MSVRKVRKGDFFLETKSWTVKQYSQVENNLARRPMQSKGMKMHALWTTAAPLVVSPQTYLLTYTCFYNGKSWVSL